MRRNRMRHIGKLRFVHAGIMILMCAVFGAATMLLWNVLMPTIFGASTINFLQAAGLLILARILFGSLGGWWGHGIGGDRTGMFHHGNHLRKKWMSMSDEERKEFFKSNKHFFDFHAHHYSSIFTDDEAEKQNEKGGN